MRHTGVLPRPLPELALEAAEELGLKNMLTKADGSLREVSVPFEASRISGERGLTLKSENGEVFNKFVEGGGNVHWGLV